MKRRQTVHDSEGLKSESVTATNTTKKDLIDGQNKYILIHFVEIFLISADIYLFRVNM